MALPRAFARPFPPLFSSLTFEPPPLSFPYSLIERTAPRLRRRTSGSLRDAPIPEWVNVGHEIGETEARARARLNIFTLPEAFVFSSFQHELRAA